MNKGELIAAVAEKANLTKKDAGVVLDALLDSITESLINGEAVQLIGFGSFGVKERAAREGRNPATGEAVKIDAKKSVHFTAGKALKAVVNK